MEAGDLLTVGLTLSGGAPEGAAAFVVDLLQFAAAVEEIGGEVGVWLCTDAEIADLHARFMGLPGPTDVLSFPGEPDPAGADYLGDIAVSIETAAAQAREMGHSTAREIGYLALHGLLHLIGYDDLDPDRRARMIARQDDLLARFEREHPDAAV